MACQAIDDIIRKFEILTQKPVKYLSVQKEIKGDIKSLVKTTYDFTKSQENLLKNSVTSALPNLIVENFDDEQIWQEIELQNLDRVDNLVWDVANCLSSKTNLTFPVETVERKKKNKGKGKSKRLPSFDSKDAISDLNEQFDDKDENQQYHNTIVEKTKPKIKPSTVDDKFFKLRDMEKFLLNEEKKDRKTDIKESDGESIDLFQDVEEDLEGEKDRDTMYADFFDHEDQSYEDNNCDINLDYNDDNQMEEQIDEEMNSELVEELYEQLSEESDESEQETEKHDVKKKKKVHFADNASEDTEDSLESDINANKIMHNNDVKKSDFEQRQQRLQQTIERLESKTLKEAPWQLKGEVDASKRPQNSLLEEVLDVDITSRPPPIITEQTTLTLEDIIKQRVKDKAWDDVIKKVKPVQEELRFHKTQVLDHSKSEQSLAQIYEAEYLKQKQAASGETVEEDEPQSHKDVREKMKGLFAKLDALCHYHYTPKSVQAEVKIVTNTPAISMEEIAPVATSDATLLAPEEIKRKLVGDLLSKNERTKTDKNRERRKKKKKQKSKDSHQTSGTLTNYRNTKKVREKADNSLNNTKAFFQQLNDDSKSLIKIDRAKHIGKNKK